MSVVTRRTVLGVVCVGLVSLAEVPPTARADEKQPFNLATIVAKKFKGKATVEFTIGEVAPLVSGRDGLPGEGDPLFITPVTAEGKAPALGVYVSWQVTTRLKQLGIENPAEHFRGKVVRVSGTVERFEGGFGPIHLAGRRLIDRGPEYRIEVTTLDQFEVIRKP